MPKYVKIILICCISFHLLVALFIGGFIYSIFYNPYRDLKCETDTAPAAMVYGTLYIGEDKVYLSQICRDHSDDYTLYDTLCVYENKAYIVCHRSGSGDLWTIATVDLKTEEIEDKYDFSTTEWYEDEREKDFSLRSSYYHNGKIVLNDSVNVAEYDIKSGESTVTPFDEYNFYKPEIQWQSLDDHTIEITENGEAKVFTLETMAKYSEEIAKLYSFKGKEDWKGDGYVSDHIPPDNNIQVINNCLYIVLSPSNYLGESFAVLLEYKDSTWSFVSSCFAGDTAYRDSYVVEIAK